ncbi:MAG: PCRF domain-containing protein, partial [Proteobacteria bacterium]|nr:PCRF domain-containing protein [Pseudomonadota bacterium]
MFAKVKEIEERYNELENALGQPEIIRDQKAYQTYAKERSILVPIIVSFRKLKSIQDEIASNQSLLSDPDPEIRHLAKEEIEALGVSLSKIERNLKILLIPKDPNDDKNILLEIRAGTGGEEA